MNTGKRHTAQQKVEMLSKHLEISRMQEGCNVSLQSYDQLKNIGSINDRLMKAVLLGLSTKDYQQVIQEVIDSFGLSRSTISREFIKESAAKLEAFENRDLSEHEFVAVFIDGECLAKEQMIIVLGVTTSGEKIPLGFIQTHAENSQSIAQLLSSLIDRGNQYNEDFLCVIDGSKGIYEAVKNVFGHFALIHRCHWHKKENIISYLKERDQKTFRTKINNALDIPSYQQAKTELLNIKAELVKINRSAARSVEEGLEEIPTLHRLGLYQAFKISFATSNCIENLNSILNKYIGKVTYWKTSEQRYRWVACALLDAEQNMRKVKNFHQLNLMKLKIKHDIESKIEKSLEAA